MGQTLPRAPGSARPAQLGLAPPRRRPALTRSPRRRSSSARRRRTSCSPSRAGRAGSSSCRDVDLAAASPPPAPARSASRRPRGRAPASTLRRTRRRPARRPRYPGPAGSRASRGRGPRRAPRTGRRRAGSRGPAASSPKAAGVSGASGATNSRPVRPIEPSPWSPSRMPGRAGAILVEQPAHRRRVAQRGACAEVDLAARRVGPQHRERGARELAQHLVLEAQPFPFLQALDPPHEAGVRVQLAGQAREEDRRQALVRPTRWRCPRRAGAPAARARAAAARPAGRPSKSTRALAARRVLLEPERAPRLRAAHGPAAVASARPSSSRSSQAPSSGRRRARGDEVAPRAPAARDRRRRRAEPLAQQPVRARPRRSARTPHQRVPAGDRHALARGGARPRSRRSARGSSPCAAQLVQDARRAPRRPRRGRPAVSVVDGCRPSCSCSAASTSCARDVRAAACRRGRSTACRPARRSAWRRCRAARARRARRRRAAPPAPRGCRRCSVPPSSGRTSSANDRPADDAAAPSAPSSVGGVKRARVDAALLDRARVEPLDLLPVAAVVVEVERDHRVRARVQVARGLGGALGVPAAGDRQARERRRAAASRLTRPRLSRIAARTCRGGQRVDREASA